MINDLDEVQYAYLLAPTFQFVNTAGKPITGGWMEVYIHGTRTKYYCCSDWDGTLHPFKIPLDSLGSNIVLASPANAYDVYVYNRFGSLIMSRYNVIPVIGGASGIVPVDIAIESEDETVNVSISGNTYNLSISGTIDKLNTVSADVEGLKAAIASGIDQVQVDWNQTDSSKVDYIKNKPDLSIYATNETVESVSGDIVNIVNEGNSNLFNTISNVSGDIITTVNSVSSTLHNEMESVSGGLIELIETVSSEIPEQVQSDWDESDETSPAYIKNKPEESTLIAGNNIGIFASGSDYVISASGVDTSEFATHTEVNNVSGILENEIQTVSAAIPDVSDFATHSEVNNVSGSIITVVNNVSSTLDNKIDAVSSSIPVVTGFVTETELNNASGSLVNYTNEVSGSLQNQINNIPEQVNADWDSTSGKSEILNKPDLSVYATNSDLQTVSASIPDVSEFVTETDLSSAINVITGTIPQAQVQSDWTEDDSTDPSFIKNKPDEVNLVAGDNISIVASGTDLIISASGSEPQPTVPNVEIVSPSGSIVVSSTVDPLTNTKTFTIDVATVSGVEYGQFYSTNVTGTATMAKTKGNLSVNEGKIQLHKGQSYHVTIRGTYTQTTLTNALDFFNFIEYVSFRSIPINVNKTISAGQYWELSYDLFNLSTDTDYLISFNNITDALLTDVFVEVHSLAGGNGAGGSASGVEYTAGYGIQILNDVISVSGIKPQVNADWDAVSGISQVLNKPDEISIVAGSGISIEESNNQLIISSTVTGGGGSGVNYQAGDHIDITNDTISVTGITELVAGTNITITMNGDSAVINAAGGQQVQSNWDEWDSSSPAYIQNKPYIPESPVQSDWNETDSGSLAYIRNKPNISEAYTGASGIAIDDSVISLDEPLGIVAGSGINIVIEGDSAIICVSGVTGGSGTNYQAGNGINITNDTISVDTTVIPDVSAVSAMITSAIPTQVNADWSATSGVAEILNKPSESNLLPGSGITIAASGNDYVINTTPIELVLSLPANPVSGVLYLIPEA